MRLIRYAYPELTRFDDMNRLLEQVDRGFSGWPSLFNFLEGSAPSTRIPVDIYEGSDGYYLRFEVPGVGKEDVSLELDNSVLNVSFEVERGANKDRDKTTVNRSVSLPDGIDIDRIGAGLENGVLTVSLPKAEERKPKTIKIGR